MALVIATPPPSSFTKNDLLITNVIESALKFKNGSYLVSSSSSASNATLPFNAFNGTTNKPWVSGKKGVSDYLQDPYNGGEPSTFVGGGLTTNRWNTISNCKDIQGEWIQIELPYSIFLSKYSILTANSSDYYNGKNYPKLFYILGSNDGVKFFNLDQQNLTDIPSDIRTPNEYNLNSNKSYTTFRLVINQLFSGSYVSITQLNLMGYQNIVVNPEAFTGLQYSSYQSVSPTIVVPSKTKRTENIDFQAYSKYDILLEGYRSFNEGQPWFTEGYRSFNEGQPWFTEGYQRFTEGYQSFTEGYQSFTEGFDNHGYVSGNVDDISNSKIGPLKKIYNDLSGSEVKMANQSSHLGTDIKAYQSLRTNLQNDQQYDFTGNQFLYNKRPQTLQDGLQEDANALIIQQNNLYILGTITVSFMIVGAIMLTK